METSGSHRLLSCQIEGHVLQAADEAADRVAAFALEIFAAIDGRPDPSRRPPRRGVAPQEAPGCRREGRHIVGRHRGRPPHVRIRTLTVPSPGSGTPSPPRARPHPWLARSRRPTRDRPTATAGIGRRLRPVCRASASSRGAARSATGSAGASRGLVVRAYLRPRLEGRERLPAGPAIYCFNHMNWIDPFVLMATLPMRPRLFFFGPKEEDMAVGGRNRLMNWTCATVPYRPGKNDLLEATRRVSAVLDSGGVLAIAGEGRIHASEQELLRLEEGPAYFALRSASRSSRSRSAARAGCELGRRVHVVVGEPDRGQRAAAARGRRRS